MCLSFEGGVLKSQEACKTAGNAQTKTLCLSLATKNAFVCQALDSQEAINDCIGLHYSIVAIQSKDPLACENLGDENYKAACIAIERKVNMERSIVESQK